MLHNKTTAGVCRFLIEEMVCRYGCVGKIVANRGELDSKRPKSSLTGWGLNSRSPRRTIRRLMGR
jgi:hypothetical protein